MAVDITSAPEQHSTPSNQVEQVEVQKNPTNYQPEQKEEPKQEKPMTAREAVIKAHSEAEGEKKDAPAPELKAEAKVEPKPEPRDRTEDGKFRAKEPTAEAASPPAEVGSERVAETVKRPSEGRDINTPPAHFLTRAKEKWPTVDADVRGEVHRMAENYEKGIEAARQDREWRKELKSFEDMATAANTTVKAALENYTAIDQQLRTNPVAALERILASINVTPQQYAQHIMGQAQKDAQNPAAAGQRQLQQQVAELQQQIANMTSQAKAQMEANQQREQYEQIENGLFAEVRQQHPRFDELRHDIALFFNSATLASISDERQRLYEAVAKAELANPAPSFGANSPAPVTPAPQTPINPAGNKSVRGAPTPGAQVQRGKVSMKPRDAVKAAMAQLGQL